MAIQLQLRRGNALQHASFTGAIGEVTFDTSNNTIRAHDGNTAGGFELALKTDLANISTGNVSVSMDLSGNTTTDLAEGDNLYFTNARAVAAVTGGATLANVALTGEYSDLANTPSIPANTADIAETTNLYFTNARAIGALTGGTGVTIEANGMLVGTAVSNTGGTVTSIGILGGNLIDIDGGPITSDGNITVNVDLSELTSRVSANAVDSIAAVDSASQEQYKVRLSNLNLSTFNNDLSLTTDTIPEASNLYFTNTRAIAALTAGDNITIEANGMIIGAADGNVNVYGDSNVAQYLTAFDTNLVPAADGTYDLGNTNYRFGAVYADSLAFGNIFLREEGLSLFVSTVEGGNVNLFTTDYITEGENNLYFSNTKAVDALTGQNVSIFINDVGYLDANVTTADVAENASNLYFTNDRVIAALTGGDNITIEANGLIVGAAAGGNVSLTDTDDLPEGTANLYFTNARAVASLTGGDGIIIDANGMITRDAITFPVQSVNGATGNVLLDTDSVPEGGNLYYSDYRVLAAIESAITTSNINEGANLYFTNDRVIAALTAGDNITIEANGMIIGEAGGGGSYGDSNVDTYLAMVDVDIVPSNTVSLGSTTNTWNYVYAENVVVNQNLTTAAAGVPTIESDTSIRLTANDSVVVTSSPLQLASFSLGEIQNLTAANGMMVYNTTNTKIQAYVNGSWVDLH